MGAVATQAGRVQDAGIGALVTVADRLAEVAREFELEALREGEHVPDGQTIDAPLMHAIQALVLRGTAATLAAVAEALDREAA